MGGFKTADQHDAGQQGGNVDVVWQGGHAAASDMAIRPFINFIRST